jgi:hypothetical protein
MKNPMVVHCCIINRFLHMFGLADSSKYCEYVAEVLLLLLLYDRSPYAN